MSPRIPHNSHTGSDTVSTAGESIRPRIGDIQGRAFEFNPPSMIRWYTLNKDQVGGFDPCYNGARTICYLRSQKQRVHGCACSDARATTLHWLLLPVGHLMTADCDMHSAPALACIIVGIQAYKCCSCHGVCVLL